MFYVKTENVDKLCVPFGIIIGPCTVLSNIVKLIGDVASLGFNGLLSINYAPTLAYRNFKAADLAWEQNVSSEHKPQFSSDGNIKITMDSFTDPEYITTISTALGSQDCKNIASAYKALSSQDKVQLVFDQAKKDSLQHLTFIGVGIIRSIPLVGGAARWIYNATKAS